MLLGLYVRTCFYESKYVQILSTVIMEDSDIFEQHGIFQALLPFGCFLVGLISEVSNFLCRVVSTTLPADSYTGPTLVTFSACSFCLRSYTHLIYFWTLLLHNISMFSVDSRQLCHLHK